jgi:NADH:ubiquinone oxidoreductase subunit 5 (subunit L)/multisubunit Na+/H+ antiporter MnhA subunit
MIPFALQVDALSLWMMLVVTGVGTLIHALLHRLHAR